MSSHDFDVIVVGAGPAGSTAARELAQQGHRVALLERGTHPGAKNLFGGMIYPVELERLYPGYAQSAPMERPVTVHRTYMLDGDRHLAMDFRSGAFGEQPYNGFTAYRSRFDAWLAGQAVQAGATLLTETLASELVYEGGLLAGVRTHHGGDPLRAPLVICADGILSLLGRKAGLVPEPNPAHYSLGVRETLAMDAEEIEARFGLERGEGCAALFAGNWLEGATSGAMGGGFIYTNRDTISVGFVAQLGSLNQGEAGIQAALEAFKRQPAVRRLIHGAGRLEYGAHIVPEAGWEMRPRLSAQGVMLAGDAAALVLAAGVIYEGVHYAMHSGWLAAQTAREALQHGDFSANRLKAYNRALGRSYVARNLKLFRRVPHTLLNPRMHGHYPQALNAVAQAFYRAEAGGHVPLRRLVWRHIIRPIGLFTHLRDAWRMFRAMF